MAVAARSLGLRQQAGPSSRREAAAMAALGWSMAGFREKPDIARGTAPAAVAGGMILGGYRPADAAVNRPK